MFKRINRNHLAVILGFLLLSAWLLNNSFADNERLYFKVDKGLFYLKQVYETISRNYVDDVDPEGLSKSAIKGIVQQLDPYTVFFEQKGSERLEIITKGKYGGLGMEIGMREGKITVIAPIDNTPAQRAGIRAGDVITKIDNVLAVELSLEEASRTLRGKPGTKVTIEIKRPGLDEAIELTMIREDIVIKDVSYANFIEPGTAVFRLTGFSDKAASELKDAIRNLKRKETIERVVLDLRGNPGGLLASAVEVANIFIPKDELIVQTRGTHEREAKFITTGDAVLPDMPLIVLVDGGSASASEIVAGAVQDLDRGVIIGEPTFGKGLVQQVYPVDKINDAFLKITTAKYYVPSGRCIQKEDYKKNKSVFLDISDSSDYDNHKEYYTRNGRVVFGGGGIKPDIKSKKDDSNQFVLALWIKGHFFNFTVEYLSKHSEMNSVHNIEVGDGILSEFQAYLDEKNMTFKIEGEEELEDFLQIARQENYNDDVIDLVQVALQKLEREKVSEFERNKEKIRESLEIEFAEKLGNSTGRIAAMLKHDKTLKKALKVFRNQEEYRQILAVGD